MKKYKNHIISIVMVFLVLVIAFVFGDKGSFDSKVCELQTQTTLVSEESYLSSAAPVVSAPQIEPTPDVSVPQLEPTPDVSVPHSEPAPVMPEETKEASQEIATLKPIYTDTPVVVQEDDENVCILSVRCDTILKNISRLAPEKIGIIPGDGIIFAEQNVVFYEGETVFNVLTRAMKQNNIHMEFVKTPLYNSAYIEGIANIYEFDCGELSGWMYKVNGWFPNYGCSLYTLKPGDKVEWVYTCDLGADVGDNYSQRNGKDLNE